MAENTQFTIGANATCSDGLCGEIIRVVVDPVARTVTHLVVEPKHRRGLGRLVPLDLVDVTTGDVHLRCSLGEFAKLDAAEETQFLAGTEYAGYEPQDVLSWPYYAGGGMSGGMGVGWEDIQQTVTYDALPVGEVAIRRGEPVHATDGEIGRVQGLVIDLRNHRVTHVLLQEGHLWGRKEVAIPIGAVVGVDNGIELRINKQQVQELPPVKVDPSGALDD